ncbi:hypothetical protein [Candidatus Nitrosotenuis cloacae]|uniref:hypothetical protein n=1 Tax=Candidatus Nitrosotenuis cloacae TaxID=1603555 RepID=UPI0022828143|nr:hypothetical protein [Candidatus Nitrosotenuis cloacae]
MSKQMKMAIIAAIVAASVIVAAYFIPAQTTVNIEPVEGEDEDTPRAIAAALDYVRISPTYAFDGIEDTIKIDKISKTGSSPAEFDITVSFESTHGGFGNREGQMLTQVMTPHMMQILVSDGTVISAVTDGTWDEQNHQYVLKHPSEKLVPSDEQVPAPSGPVSDYASLVDSIKSRGIAVEPVEELDDSPFSTPTKVISVGGATIQVYEFQSESDAESARLTVSEDGTEIGTSIIRWMDTPHFYAKGKIIVLYVGQNPEVTSLLEAFLGNQFAGM